MNTRRVERKTNKCLELKVDKIVTFSPINISDVVWCGVVWCGVVWCEVK
jgi:hypothetical protein